MFFTIKDKIIKMKLENSQYWLITSYDNKKHLLPSILPNVSGYYKSFNKQVISLEQIINILKKLDPNCEIEFLEPTKKIRSVLELEPAYRRISHN